MNDTMPKGKLKRNEVMRPCRYNFSQEELADLGPQAGEARHALALIEAEFDSIKKDYKVRIETRAGALDLLLNKLRDGYEMRETLCFWAYDHPEAGKKSLTRSDTLEVIETVRMDESDRQLVMDAIDDIAAAAGTPERPSLMGAWPETLDEVVGAMKPADGESWIVDLVVSVFQNYEVDDGEIGTREQAGAVVASLMQDTPTEELRQVYSWLVDYAQVPGIAWLRGELWAGLEKLKASEAKAKKAAKKGRKASGPGTVDVEADEGSRDDMGADSKEDL